MKTTLEFPDDLLIRAKKRAAEERRPLRELVEEGLRSVMDRRRGAARAARPAAHKVRWIVHPGGIPADLQMDDRAAMHDWLNRQS